MGFFGGDDNGSSRGEELLDEQMELNKAELESKRQNLYDTRLDIIKGQGGQSWTPSRTGASSKSGGMSPMDRAKKAHTGFKGFKDAYKDISPFNSK